MRWYELKRYERHPGGPSTGRMADAVVFEADSDGAAQNEAHRRARTLAVGHFVLLLGPDGNQLGVYEAPHAQGS